MARAELVWNQQRLLALEIKKKEGFQEHCGVMGVYSLIEQYDAERSKGNVPSYNEVFLRNKDVLAQIPETAIEGFIKGVSDAVKEGRISVEDLAVVLLEYIEEGTSLEEENVDLWSHPHSSIHPISGD